MRGFIDKALFFIGWLLSPLTPWNDVVVNIPIAYICAVISTRIFRVDFLLAMVISYWATNLIGLLLMYISGKNIIKDIKGDPHKRLIKLIASCLIYTVILVLLYKVGMGRGIIAK